MWVRLFFLIPPKLLYITSFVNDVFVLAMTFPTYLRLDLGFSKEQVKIILLGSNLFLQNLSCWSELYWLPFTSKFLYDFFLTVYIIFFSQISVLSIKFLFVNRDLRSHETLSWYCVPSLMSLYFLLCVVLLLILSNLCCQMYLSYILSNIYFVWYI